MNKEELRTQKITFWWRWWDEAEHKSTPEKRLAFYDALMRYIFTGETPPDPVEMDDPSGVAWAAYDATHYFDVIDSAVGGPVPESTVAAIRHKRGGQPGNKNASKTSSSPVNNPVNKPVDNAGLKNEYKTNNKTNTILKHNQSETNKNESKTNTDIRFVSNVDVVDGNQEDSSSFDQSLKTNKTNTKTNQKRIENECKTNTLKNKERRIYNIPPIAPLEGGDGVRGDECFERFWKAYPNSCPRKVDKKKCRAKFLDLFKAAEDKAGFVAELMSGLERWKVSETWQKDGGEFIRAPLVWLNNESWNDMPKPSGDVRPEIARVRADYDWGLCVERCSQYVGGICGCGWKVPPQERERPVPPEECHGFSRKQQEAKQEKLL